MKTVMVLLTTLSLVGCGDDNHGYGYEYDFISQDSIRFRNLPGSPSITEEEFRRFVVPAFHQVEACTGLHADGPLIVVAEMNLLGYTYFDNGLILIHPDVIRDQYPFFHTIRHESVHYLLSISGDTSELNSAHKYQYFWLCS